VNTRDSLHVGLLRQGVKAKLAKTFQPEECIGNGKSLGLIEVDLGSVRWVNVRKLNVESADVYRADLGVPDMRLRKFPEVERIEIVSRSGKQVPVRWSGNDLDLGIIEALNRDPALQDELAPAGRSMPDYFTDWREDAGVVIHAHLEQRCWTISFAIETRMPAVLGFFGGRRLRVPQSSELTAYQQIGRILLNNRLSNFSSN
jgi:hypothetical protein